MMGIIDDDDDDDDTLVIVSHHNRCRPNLFYVSRVALDPIGDAEGA